MVMLNDTFAEPPELLAKSVYMTAVVWFTDGVPLNIPPAIVIPFGKAGDISQV